MQLAKTGLATSPIFKTLLVEAILQRALLLLILGKKSSKEITLNTQVVFMTTSNDIRINLAKTLGRI